MHITAIEFVRRQAQYFISRLRLRQSRVADLSVVCVLLLKGCRRGIGLRGVEVIKLACTLQRISHGPRIQVLLDERLVVLIRVLVINLTSADCALLKKLILQLIHILGQIHLIN